MHAITRALATFDPISLGEMEGAALQDRIEVKYLMRADVLPRVLRDLDQAYDVLVAGAKRLSRYQTLYFDTADFAMYRRQHSGALNTYKVRSREYVDSCSYFLEVKFKTNRSRTIKQRRQTGELVTGLDADSGADLLAFIEETCPYRPQDLRPRLWNMYRRITLVSKARDERVTLDTGLDFVWQDRLASLPGIVIAEIKHERASSDSPFIGAMRKYHVRSRGFSKYCMGVSLLHPEIKHNNFKVKQGLVARLMAGDQAEALSSRGGDYRVIG